MPARERLSSAGRPAPLVQVAILGEEGHEVTGGERGEICVRSSLVMAGYYKNPEATAEAGRHGWHHTGDIGYLDRQDMALARVERPPRPQDDAVRIGIARRDALGITIARFAPCAARRAGRTGPRKRGAHRRR